jgi:hypothetical protein
MALHFQAREGSSYDRASGISIPEPRILPAELPDGKQGTEYQFGLYQSGERIGALGFLGTDEFIESDGWREHVFFFDLGHDWLIEDLLAIKRRIDNSDGDYLYLQQFSRGLVLAYAGQTNNKENSCYVVTTTSAALASCRVLIAGENPVLANGAVVLAEVSIPARFAR